MRIGPDDPHAVDVRALLERHLAFARATTRPEEVFALEVSALGEPDVSFFSCREDGRVLGVGALKRLSDADAEIKSMHTASEARGRGVGAAVLDELLRVARERGFRRVSLETGAGDAFAPARALYARAGFVPCGAFGSYAESPRSAYMTLALERNLAMAERVSSLEPRYPYSFVVAGDSGAWPDPTADAIVGSLLAQAEALDPVFFANLGDFAGPGTVERHEDWLRLVSGLSVPNLCVVGNHDLDDAGGLEAWARVHGPRNYEFAYGNTRFVVLDAAPGEVGEVDIDPGSVAGPDEEALAFLDAALSRAAEPVRVVLMHCPPAFGGRFAPHPEWGFSVGEREFLALVERHGVALVCCAHALLFDTWVHGGTRFVVSGGGGTALCSHFRGVCAAGGGRPEDRGALFHAVEIVVAEDGAISGRVHQAFGGVRFTF
jgi:putative acetyltransferase